MKILIIIAHLFQSGIKDTHRLKVRRLKKITPTIKRRTINIRGTIKMNAEKNREFKRGDLIIVESCNSIFRDKYAIKDRYIVTDVLQDQLKVIALDIDLKAVCEPFIIPKSVFNAYEDKNIAIAHADRKENDIYFYNLSWVNKTIAVNTVFEDKGE